MLLEIQYIHPKRTIIYKDVVSVHPAYNFGAYVGILFATKENPNRHMFIPITQDYQSHYVKEDCRL